MPKALELLAGFATAPSTTLTALTMSTGLSNTVRNFPEADKAAIVCMWSDNQAQGQFQIRSPRMHDNVQGINIETNVGGPLPLTPLGMQQKIYPQDTLSTNISGSAAAGDIETGCWLNYYDNLPGIDARLMKWDDIKDKIESYMISTNTIATGTAGGFSGSQAINTTVDNWKANRDYALLGYKVSLECAAVRWLGSDTGNLGVGGPGNITQSLYTAEWFKLLSQATDLPLIPIFNAANKQSILIDAAQDENGADPVVTSIFGLLIA